MRPCSSYKLAFVLIDGVGDVSVPPLGEQTPLQAAHIPFLDVLSGKPHKKKLLLLFQILTLLQGPNSKVSRPDIIADVGLNGLLDPVEPGLACGSDTAHLSILGYEPRQ